jgi:hypothetical protein
MKDTHELTGGVQMVSRQSPNKRAVGCIGALLSFGYCCVEVCPKVAMWVLIWPAWA